MERALDGLWTGFPWIWDLFSVDAKAPPPLLCGARSALIFVGPT